MDKILYFFVDVCHAIWQSIIDFKIPIFDSYVPFAYVIGSIFVFSMFAKIICGLFDLNNSMNDYYIHKDSVILAKERILQRNSSKKFNKLVDKSNGHISTSDFNSLPKNIKVVNSRRGYTDSRSFYDVKKKGGK